MLNMANQRNTNQNYSEVSPHTCQHNSNSVKLCLTLCNPTDCSPPGSSVHWILQTRILEWVAIPFSRGSSQPRVSTQPRVSCITGRFFIIWAREIPLVMMVTIKKPHITNIGEDVEKGNLCTLLIEMSIGTATMEKENSFLKKEKKE